MSGMWLYYGIPLLCILISGYASAKVRSAFHRYEQIRSRSGFNGHDTAVRLLTRKGIHDIAVGSVGGELTDHYHPAKGIVNLSASSYGSVSVAAAAVAAHEIGHVVQQKEGYWPYHIRSAMVPAVNLSSRLALPLIMVGLLLETGTRYGSSRVGWYLAITGVILYAGAVLFALVTLPVEWDASRRAKQMLLEEGILSEEELPGAERVLSAAAMTYAASLLVSILYMVRFLLLVLSAFGRRSQRR